jgi:outer membrane protein OmpA-like peptidoglycan-associated protein
MIKIILKKKSMSTLHNIFKKVIGCSFALLLIQASLYAQTTQPKWWFGVSGGANANFYNGTTQRLDNTLIVPTAFHKGNGVRPFASVLMEYRPTQTWGGMLNIGFDGRAANFKDVVAPCNCPATLTTNLSYLTVEPALRLNPWNGSFYLFAGPRIAFNLQKEYNYTQLKQADAIGDISNVRETILSGQVGMGFDIPMSAKNSTNKVLLSPFVSFHPYFGQDVRSIESWSNTTVRAGLALKFGKGKKAVTETVTAPVVAAPDVNFSVRAPKTILMKRVVSETLPLLNYVFFDEGSTTIPTRYNLISPSTAAIFKEQQLQAEQPVNYTGRAARQLNVYYNVLNILGDRMRTNPGANITLSGASLSGPTEGKALADAVKNYLVDVFVIDGSRISVNGRTKPANPSEQPGGKKELVLLREGDRRVDIQSSSSDLMMEVGGGMMKPVVFNATQSDPMDSYLLFNVAKATEVLQSYNIDLTDKNGQVTHYGPFTKNQESVLGKAVLGNNKSGDYKVTLIGTSKLGTIIKKETTVHIESQEEQIEKGMRYSILFNFNRSFTVATYSKFLKEVVVPLIADYSTVVIHGHTDVIGTDTYNLNLSQKRAKDAQQLLQSALNSAGKNNVKFETSGSGEDLSQAPFDNNRPEERFYNRTVIIDINPGK